MDIVLTMLVAGITSAVVSAIMIAGAKRRIDYRSGGRDA